MEQINLIFTATSHTFTPPLSWVQAWRRHHLVPWEKFRLDSYFGCPAWSSSERISHGWVNGSPSERVGMRHEFGLQLEFCPLLGLRRWKASSV